MSRLAKKPVILPQGVAVECKDGELKVKGPKGELNRKIPREIVFNVQPNEVRVGLAAGLEGTSAVLGSHVRHLQNMVEGVLKGFEKRLELEGVGFKAEVRGGALVLNIGFSHPVTVVPPEGVVFAVEKNVIIVSGLDKEKVGKTAAVIRSRKKPEPYKGKGIRYAGEVIRRKAGKKVVASG